MTDCGLLDRLETGDKTTELNRFTHLHYITYIYILAVC